MKQELIVQTVGVSILPLRCSGCGDGWEGFTCIQCSARWSAVGSCSWVPPSPGWTVSKETCKDVGNLDIIFWSLLRSKESKHFGVICSAQTLFPTALTPDELSFRAAGQWGFRSPPVYLKEGAFWFRACYDLCLCFLYHACITQGIGTWAGIWMTLSVVGLWIFSLLAMCLGSHQHQSSSDHTLFIAA